MREQLVNYVELLFAGAPDSNEIKQEILQNTLDRYDDLLAQGKSPEAAYRLAISGIGDISEILNAEPIQEDTFVETKDAATEPVMQYASPEAPVSNSKKSSSVLRVLIISITVLLGLSILVGGILAALFAVNGAEIIGEITEELGIELNLGDTALDGTTASAGSVSAEEVSQIEIEWAAGSITIVPGDTETIDFSETAGLSPEDQLIWKQSGSTLQIQFCKPKIHVGISIADLNKDLVITVPQDWACENLQIEAASAEVNVQSLNIDNFYFDGASGQCILENCQIDEVDLDTASGTIFLHGTVNYIDCDAASANCCLVLENTPKRIEVDSASGDLEISLPQDCGFTVSMEGLSGNFSSDFPTTFKNGKHLYGDGSCRIDISALSGSVIIREG